MIVVRLITTFTYNLLRKGKDYALFSVMMRLLGSFYNRVGVYKEGEALYAATNEYNLQQCMTTYLNEEDNNSSDSDSDDPSHVGEGQCN